MAAGIVVATLLAILAVGRCAIDRSAGPDGAHNAPSTTDIPRSVLPTVAVADLPAQARETLVLVDRGGPFPYAKDGTTFNNFEGRLPTRSRGYYREYTVPTPGERDRGARRLVVGDGRDVYYTDDHYESFRQVVR